MRERGVTLLLAAGALVAFYGLWLRPAPSLDPDSNLARPTSAERRGNGYAGLYEWLQKTGVRVRSWRERYTALDGTDLSPRGNLMVLTLPGLGVFNNDEFAALDRWVRRGNTLLINAALMDQPGWAADRESGTVVDVESLTAIEFETRQGREIRLDDTPLSQRVRDADERDAKQDEEEEDEALDEVEPFNGNMPVPEKIVLTATGPHALLQGVHTLGLETDYVPKEWSLRIPYDNFVLTLARDEKGEGALFEQRVGAGRILLAAGGTLFSNRALGNDDNARLFANIVSVTMASDGVVLFDDLRQGLSASYNPERFYSDPRLLKTILIALGLWLVWVLGGTRLRAPAIVHRDPSEADLVRSAGGLIARTVAPWQQAQKLFDQFFAAVSRAIRGANALHGAERAEQWSWLERHAAILPQELDQLKTWYADTQARGRPPLVPLQNLLDKLERRITT